jgi:hypothetical protein
MASSEMHGVDQMVLVPTPTEANVARQALELSDTVPLVKLEIPSSNVLWFSQTVYH